MVELEPGVKKIIRNVGVSENSRKRIKFFFWNQAAIYVGIGEGRVGGNKPAVTPHDFD